MEDGQNCFFLCTVKLQGFVSVLLYVYIVFGSPLITNGLRDWPRLLWKSCIVVWCRHRWRSSSKFGYCLDNCVVLYCNSSFIKKNGTLGWKSKCVAHPVGLKQFEFTSQQQQMLITSARTQLTFLHLWYFIIGPHPELLITKLFLWQKEIS